MKIKRTDTTSPLYSLAGRVVTNVVALHGYIQLHFGNLIGISIYNTIVICPKTQRIEKFVGKTVASVIEKKDAIDIKFVDGAQITIDMRPEAYQGPEALELSRHGYPSVIWN
jgi:hypothetical protein